MIVVPKVEGKVLAVVPNSQIGLYTEALRGAGILGVAEVVGVGQMSGTGRLAKLVQERRPVSTVIYPVGNRADLVELQGTGEVTKIAVLDSAVPSDAALSLFLEGGVNNLRVVGVFGNAPAGERAVDAAFAAKERVDFDRRVAQFVNGEKK